MVLSVFETDTVYIEGYQTLKEGGQGQLKRSQSRNLSGSSLEDDTLAMWKGKGWSQEERIQIKKGKNSTPYHISSLVNVLQVSMLSKSNDLRLTEVSAYPVMTTRTRLMACPLWPLHCTHKRGELSTSRFMDVVPFTR